MDKEVQQDKYSDCDMSISIESMDLESPPKRRPYSDRPNRFLDTDGESISLESISLESIDCDESDGGPTKNEMIAAILQRVKEQIKIREDSSNDESSDGGREGTSGMQKEREQKLNNGPSMGDLVTAEGQGNVFPKKAYQLRIRRKTICYKEDP